MFPFNTNTYCSAGHTSADVFLLFLFCNVLSFVCFYFKTWIFDWIFNFTLLFRHRVSCFTLVPLLTSASSLHVPPPSLFLSSPHLASSHSHLSFPCVHSIPHITLTLCPLSPPFFGDTFFQSMSIMLYSFAQFVAVLNTTFRSSELRGNCAKTKTQIWEERVHSAVAMTSSD